MPDRLDRNLLAELESIMEDDFTSLLEAYLVDSSQRFADAVSAWHRGDMDALRRNAHSLKGSSSNVGAVDLAEFCCTLEHLARDERVDEVPLALAQVRAELDEVRNAVAALCGR